MFSFLSLLLTPNLHNWIMRSTTQVVCSSYFKIPGRQICFFSFFLSLWYAAHVYFKGRQTCSLVQVCHVTESSGDDVLFGITANICGFIYRSIFPLCCYQLLLFSSENSLYLLDFHHLCCSIAKQTSFRKNKWLIQWVDTASPDQACCIAYGWWKSAKICFKSLISEANNTLNLPIKMWSEDIKYQKEISSKYCFFNCYYPSAWVDYYYTQHWLCHFFLLSK